MLVLGTSTVQRLWPGHLPPSQEVKPSQGIVWPGSLFTTHLASTIPALGSWGAPGQKAEKLGVLGFENLLQPPSY